MVRPWALLMLLPCISLAQRMEEQRKYFFTKDSEHFEGTSTLGDLKFVPHSIYLTEDIYFEGQDKRLKHAQIGLRLRRVRKGDAAPTYALQVKSEMDAPGSLRIEEEDKDLGHQKFKGIFLTEVIERIIKAKKIMPEDMEYLEQWLTRKELSSMAPMQELRRKGILVPGLKPVLIGSSHRRRFHVVFDRKEKVSTLLLLKNSEKNEQLVPPLIKSMPSWVWIMEASWDKSRFIPASGLKHDESPFELSELEIENKYRPREMGTFLMNKLENILLEKGALSGKESKFFQAQVHFRRNDS